MSVAWRFTPKTPGEKTRDPVAGEFFSQDAIKNAGEALVREAIQNSLDARADRQNGQAKVRIFLSGPGGAVKSGDHAAWFGTAWPHYSAPKNGLRTDVISRDKPCGFLVFEDFGTSGLTGDWEQTDVVDGAKNAFFYFFRAEGATEKSSDQLGRWGIGKQVFPRSSNAQTLFGFSVTKERPSGFLMGSCILKHHKVGDTTYRPDGYFGESRLLKGGHEISVPTENPRLIEDFRRHFNLKRAQGQAGLSVIVPWLDEGEEGGSGFAKDALLTAIFEGYYMPILEGKLEVEVEDAMGSVRINKDTFSNTLDGLIARIDADRRAKVLKRTQALVRLCAEIRSSVPLVFNLNPCPPGKAEWREETLSLEMAKNIREALVEGRLVKVRAGLTVRNKSAGDSADVFTCYLRKEDGYNEKPCHIREDLIISNVAKGRVNGFVSLVRIEAGPLANLLGDSENPAHTEWQKSSRNFKDKYVYGGNVIDFITDFVTELLRRVHASDAKLDKDLLQQYFSDPGPDAVSPDKPPKKKPGEKEGEGDENQPPKPPEKEIPESRVELKITPLVDGFTVSSTGWPVDQNAKVEILAAYETTKGNPFKAYSSYDFDFKGQAKGAELDGCTILLANENTILLSVESPAFTITVKGFDTNRDIIVRASIKREEPAS
jgi:hypothetical protein